MAKKQLLPEWTPGFVGVEVDLDLLSMKGFRPGDVDADHLAEVAGDLALLAKLAVDGQSHEAEAQDLILLAQELVALFANIHGIQKTREFVESRSGWGRLPDLSEEGSRDRLILEAATDALGNINRCLRRGKTGMDIIRPAFTLHAVAAADGVRAEIHPI